MATQKFSKFIRPEAGPLRPITDRDLDIIDAVLRYRFCSAAQIVRLAGGNEDVTHRRLRRLWERGLVARWAFPGFRTHSEFYYYLDKATGAWDALAGGLIKAGFIITASWPINTEAEGSLHIRDKASARSTIFLVCRARDEAKPDADEVTHWEDIEPKVAAAVRKRVAEFQEAGIRGVDLYLACFGPALQVFSEFWPLKRGRARQEQPGRQKRLFEKRDPYEVRAEDALEAARREVKNWRMQQLASLQRQHQMDPLTEWFVLAWDAFRAPRFPSDEAIKLARVVGLDFEKQVKNVVCEIKGDDVVLWDTAAGPARAVLAGAGGGVVLKYGD